MTKNHQIRVVKREQQAGLAEFDGATRAGHDTTPTEREMKAVVAGWVREHRERSEERRHTLAAMFGGVAPMPARAA